ncbi:DEAD/DEAH box helicase [Marinicellulosiphila megalodicopiae]|uniref:DEAD/DEAH box helicase n=1 Tax=Marinicellulosiphila megalodicopiae TaxID=2724896 RepID=UPI003BB0F00E
MQFTPDFFNEALLKNILKKGYQKPSDIQKKVFTPILNKQDIAASAQTGTGKTAAFVLPILQSMLTNYSDADLTKFTTINVVVLTPTRELALQVFEQFDFFAKDLEIIKPALVIGGEKIDSQILKINQGVNIIVATLGRLIDLQQQAQVDLTGVHTLVLDEADRMLDLGFEDELASILQFLPQTKQTLLFSATYPESVKKVVAEFLNNPVYLSSSKQNTANKNIKQWLYEIDKKNKPAAIMKIIEEYNQQQSIVFCKTKQTVDDLDMQLRENGFHSRAIHSDKPQHIRNSAMTQFKNRDIQVLIATDIAARGLDIKQLPIVINYDFPFVAEDYIHRIGRTGRAGEKGMAISLASAEQYNELIAIEYLLKHVIQRDTLEGLEPIHNMPNSFLQKPKEKQIRKKKAKIKIKQNNRTSNHSKAPDKKSTGLELKPRKKRRLQ